jgi:hypothetical protein
MGFMIGSVFAAEFGEAQLARSRSKAAGRRCVASRAMR